MPVSYTHLKDDCLMDPQHVVGEPLCASTRNKAGILDQEIIVNRVSVGLDQHLVIEDQMFGGHRDRFGRPRHVRNDAVGDCSGTDRGRVFIAGSDEYRARYGEPKLGGRSRGEHAGDLAGAKDFAQLIRTETDGVEQFVGPGSGSEACLLYTSRCV